MKVTQEIYQEGNGWEVTYKKGEISSANLVLCFGSRSLVSQEKHFDAIKAKYPNAEIVMSSTSGEIVSNEVKEDTMVLTAMEFEHTVIKAINLNVSKLPESQAIGQAIAKGFQLEALNHIFILADGQLVNGSELVKGLSNFNGQNVTVTGGLAGDGYNFTETFVGINQTPSEGNIVAIAFYGDRLKVGYGSKGGWDAFGPERLVTKSNGNVLLELDGISALSLYKKYLGEAAEELPGSALFFPLSLKMDSHSKEEDLVRTILSVDEKNQSMTFAGDIPQGSMVRLMRHNVDNLIEGAESAAEQSLSSHNKINSPDVAILISCVGRKFVLGQMVEEEVESIKELLGDQTAITGFYSYGEIAPQVHSQHCQFHNQTMTVTTLTEI